MELPTANTCKAELDGDLQTTLEDLTTSQAATQEIIKPFYAIQGAVRNMTRQMDDARRIVVETVRLLVDRIRTPS